VSTGNEGMRSSTLAKGIKLGENDPDFGRKKKRK